MKIKSFLFLLIFQLSFLLNFAQRTAVYTNPDAGYKKALELFEKEKYSSAQREFSRVLQETPDQYSENRMNTEFYSALCSFKLYNNDAEEMFLSFLNHHPSSPKVKITRFYLAIFNYRKQNWTKAVEWFEQIHTHDLTTVDLAEYNFKLGYSYLQKNDTTKAQAQFYTSKGEESEYKISALFYYSHIEYSKGNLETALIGFDQLRNDPDFGPIVPYYIAQIYYLQKKNQELVDYAIPLLENAKPARIQEISRLIGDGYYEMNQYDKALPYLQKFAEANQSNTNEDIYQMAYTHYKLQQYKEAVILFQKVVDKDTPMGQMALYYIGDSYMHLNNKEAARNAFRFASKADFDTIVAENSTFNYAKLSYELSIDPYHEAIYALEDFIKRFPESSRIDDARKYLLEVYLTTNDYRQAIDAIEKIKNKGPELQYAYQRISYFRAIELFNDEKILQQEGKLKENFINAIFFFDKSLKYKVDPKIVAECHYWKGEAYYRLNKIDSALNCYNKFLASHVSPALKEEKEVYYNIGYCYFDKQDYKLAAEAFRKYFAENEKLRSPKMNDALIKVADCYIVTKGYNNAVQYYSKALEVGDLRGDYTMKMLARSYELLARPTDQADVLVNLINKYPHSVYQDDAKMTLALIYFSAKKYDEAIRYYNKVIAEHSNNSDLVQQAYAGIGAIYRAQNKNEEAIGYYENAIKENPMGAEAKTLLEIHKDLSIALSNLERHELFRGSIGAPPIGTFEKDSISFAVAEKHYNEKHYESAISNLKSYLTEFPNGFFALQANYFLAQSLYTLERYTESLNYYRYVVEKPKGEYTENSLYRAALILQSQAQTEEAVKYFLSLEDISQVPSFRYDAQIHLMRDYAAKENHEKAIEYANKVLENANTSAAEKQEAHMILARNYLALFTWDSAKIHYDIVASGTQNELAAEAKYSLAYILYVQMKYDASIDAVYNYAKKMSNYPKWVTKGLLLLSDDYLAKDDKFQAKYALKTIIDNFKGEESLKQEAIKKLESIEASEVEQSAPAPQEEIIIRGNESGAENQEAPKEEVKPLNEGNNEGK